MATTYADLYIRVRNGLRKENIPAADTEARELVCKASGKTKEEYFRDLNLYVPSERLNCANEFFARHLSGEPIAYILGEWDFYGLTLTITRDVLIPRSDSEVLVESSISFARGRKSPVRVLDLCTGSGCIGLAIAARVPDCKAVLSDYSDKALHVTRENVRRCNLSGRTTVINLDALALPPAGIGMFDLIVCNPPYIPSADIATLDSSVRDYEPLDALDGGEDGLLFYRCISKNWKKVLSYGGGMFFEVGVGEAKAVSDCLMQAGFKSIVEFPDTHGIMRVIKGICE